MDKTELITRFHQPNTDAKVPQLFQEWPFKNNILDYRKEPVNEFEIINKVTNVIYAVCFVTPRIEKISNSIIQQKHINFWTQVGPYPNELIEETIRSNFAEITQNLVYPFVNNFSISKLSSNLKHTIFHYIYHNPEIDIGKDKFCTDSLNHVSYNTLIDKIHDTNPTIILDCNSAGTLLDVVIQLSRSPDRNKMITFFSCKEGVIFPKSPELPEDFFTACLVTPHKMAIAWHLRSFQDLNGASSSNVFIESEDQDEDSTLWEIRNSVLKEVKTFLELIIEGIAASVLPQNTFQLFFRWSNDVRKLSSGFFLAQKLMSYFNVQPFSYPELPDLTNRPEWDTIDLFIDSACYRIKNGIPLFTMSSFVHELFFTFRDSMVEYPPQMSFVSLMLEDRSIRRELVHHLLNYADESKSNLNYLLHFHIITNLGKMICENDINNEVVLLLVKLFACCDPSFYVIKQDKFQTVNALLNNYRDIELYILLATIMVRLKAYDFHQYVEAALKLPYKFTGRDRVWYELFVAMAARQISDPTLFGELLDRFEKHLKSPDCEMRIIGMFGIHEIIQNSKPNDVQQHAMSIAMSYVYSPCAEIKRCANLSIKKTLTESRQDDYSIPASTIPNSYIHQCIEPGFRKTIHQPYAFQLAEVSGPIPQYSSLPSTKFNEYSHPVKITSKIAFGEFTDENGYLWRGDSSVKLPYPCHCIAPMRCGLTVCVDCVSTRIVTDRDVSNLPHFSAVYAARASTKLLGVNQKEVSVFDLTKDNYSTTVNLEVNSACLFDEYNDIFAAAGKELTLWDLRESAPYSIPLSDTGLFVGSSGSRVAVFHKNGLSIVDCRMPDKIEKIGIGRDIITGTIFGNYAVIGSTSEASFVNLASKEINLQIECQNVRSMSAGKDGFSILSGDSTILTWK